MTQKRKKRKEKKRGHHLNHSKEEEDRATKMTTHDYKKGGDRGKQVEEEYHANKELVDLANTENSSLFVARKNFSSCTHGNLCISYEPEVTYPACEKISPLHFMQRFHMAMKFFNTFALGVTPITLRREIFKKTTTFGVRVSKNHHLEKDLCNTRTNIFYSNDLFYIPIPHTILAVSYYKSRYYSLSRVTMSRLGDCHGHHMLAELLQFHSL